MKPLCIENAAPITNFKSIIETYYMEIIRENTEDKGINTEGSRILTKYIDAQLSINRREKAIHKMNKPPCYVKGDRNW